MINTDNPPPQGTPSVEAAAGADHASAPTSRRDRIVATAASLFHTKGYAATGLAEILAESGSGSGSLYHYFENKEALLLAVLDHLERVMESTIFGPRLAAIEPPVERLFAVLEFYRQFLTETDCALGCPVGNLVGELADSHPDVRARLDECLAGWRRGIEQILADVNPLPLGLTPESGATFVLAVMEGGVLQARASRRLDAFTSCVATLRALFVPTS